MSDFSLHQLVADALDRSKSPDPAVVAEAVAGAIPPRHLRAAVAALLPGYVSGVITSSRFKGLDDVPERTDQVGSRRWTAASTLLRTPIAVNDEWKWLRDCTRDELLEAAADRRSRAASIIANAEKLEALAALMQKRGASVAGDLGEDAIRKVLAA